MLGIAKFTLFHSLIITIPNIISLRSTAMAITLAAARLGAILGNIAFGNLVDVACAVPILLVAALLIGIISISFYHTRAIY